MRKPRQSPRWGILLLALLNALALPGQSEEDAIEVYPVRVGHRVGFVKFYPAEDTVYVDTIIPPLYDYIGNDNLPWNTVDKAGGPSPYRLFERNNRVGLLGPYLQEVLPNRYNRIRPLTKNYFALERDSLFQLFGREGQVLLGGSRYDDICPAYPDKSGRMCFFVQKGIRWGLQRIDGEMLIPPRFLRLLPAGARGYFKVIRDVKAPKGWRVANHRGKIIGPWAAEEVLVLDGRTIAQRHKGRWSILQKKRGKWSVIRAQLMSVDRINSRLAVLHSIKGKTIDIWAYGRDTILRSFSPQIRTDANTPPDRMVFSDRPHLYFPWVYPLDSTFSILCEDGNRGGYVERLIDSDAQNRSDAYAAILPTSKPGLYRVNRFGLWGLVAPNYGGTLLDCQLHHIGPFQDDIAITRLGNTYGAIHFRNGQFDTIPAVHGHIERSGKRLLAKLGGQIVAYEPDENGQLQAQAAFGNLSLVAKNTNRIKAASARPKVAAKPYKPRRPDFGNVYPKRYGGRWYLEKHQERPFQEDSMLWRRHLPVEKAPMNVQETVENEVLHYSGASVLVTDAGLRHCIGNRTRGIRFFDHQAKEALPHPPIIGIRPFDERYPYTAFLGPDGKMGLIDRRGRQLKRNGKPLRFTYIGPFEAGRARVCLNAAWTFVQPQSDPPQPYKFQLGSPRALREQLQIQPAYKTEAPAEGVLFLTDAPNQKRQWAYINQKGEMVLEVEAGYVENFHWQDSTALVARKNGERDPFGHPDASFGLMDYAGEEVLPARYDRIARLQDFYLLTVDGTPTFFFTQRGHEIFVNPTRLRPFSEGMAQFRDSSGRWGYVSINGEVAIPPKYKRARPFSGGLALVEEEGGRCVYVDKTGRVAFRTGFSGRQWRGLGDFHGGRCWFKGPGWSWGLFDTEGQVVLEPSVFFSLSGRQLPPADEAYPLPIDFQHGLASVQFKKNGRLQAAVLDTFGQKVLDFPDWHYISPFNEQGLARYQLQKGGPYGLLHRSGEKRSAARFAQIGAFQEGFAPVRNEAGKWGLLRSDGSLAFAPAYARLGRLSEGLLPVKWEERAGWHYIDTSGQLRIRGPFDRAAPFYEGVTAVQKDGVNMGINQAGQRIRFRHGEPAFFTEGVFGIRPPAEKGRRPAETGYYADASGNNLFGREFAEVNPFQLGVAKVRPKGKENASKQPLGAINRRGVMVVPPKYRRLHIQPDGNIIINPQRFYGLADKSGKTILPPQFDRIDRLSEEGLFKVERGEKIGYYLLREGKAVEVWGLQY